MRFALGLEYQGTVYAGWQRQPEITQTVTIQSMVERVVSEIANQPISIVCCGRTDAGVHAVQQVVHFDTSAIRSVYAWVRGVNTLLPKNISLRWALPVEDNFHARHSAVERRYTYIIYNHAVRPAVLNNQVGWVYKPLSLHLMQEAAQLFIGQHDFSSFRASECQAHTPIRTITQLTIEQNGALFLFHIQANAFLHHMIRNMVASLVYVGTGKWSIHQLDSVFRAKDRRYAAPTFSPNGLYFCGAIYPKQFNIPEPINVQCLMI